MKTKKLLFCLLLLIMGTTTAWADKYYTVGKRVTGQLEIGTGKKYMIFNTTYDGTQNRSGFLYNMGTTFGLKKFTSVDKFVCNEAFVFQLEDAGDDDTHTFYLKSVPSGGYMDLDGRQSVTPTVLNLYTWDEAREGDVYTVSTGGVTLTDNNSIKQACVKSLNASYTVVTENNVTSESNAVYVIANQDNSWYFNGNTDSYATWTDGHPYAFYECQEITSAETFNLQDLHIYSRADYYSAQKMYGFVQDASLITSNPATDCEGETANLIDGNFKTYYLTNPNDNSQVHYYQINLKESVSSLRLYMASRSDKKYAPLEYEILATNDPNDKWVKVSEGNTTTLNTYLAYVSPIIDLGADYQYIRIQAPNGRSSAEQCLALSELYVLPNRAEINNSMAYFDNSLPVAAPESDFKAIIDRYNANATASAAKLFSGVPIPGNKYRIYADAYSGDAYVNRHVNIKADGETRSLNALGDYFTAGDAQEAFEWYCEESTDGKLLFRNVKYPDLYLANSRVVTVDSISEAKWTINTNHTQHQGVPLINRHGQYLTVYNDGAHWAGDVKKAMSQTIVTGTLDIKNTPDNADDDVQANGGLCTDFVFIPVDLDSDEVRLTITASELGNRNSTLTVGGETYELPFSKVFYNGVPEITIESTAGEFYTFTGFYKGDEKIGDAIDDTLFKNSTLANGDVVEARFEVKKLPAISTKENIVLYQIKNRKAKTIQNAGMSRAGIGYDDDDDEFISMENGKDYFYASFVTKDEPLELSNNKDSLTANSFFYFTNSEPTTGENYQAYINSAITTFRNNSPNEWNSGGSLYHIQPNAVNGNSYGFAITRTQLNESNNPYGWNAQYTDTGNTVVEYGVEDANSAWEFVQVEETVAKEKLTLYIKEVAAEMITHLTAQLDTAGVDNEKINNTIDKIEKIAGTYADGQFDSNGAISTAKVTALVGYAQELHMLHHEVEYAMQAIPESVDENAEPFNPQWYYIKNVCSGSYARYNGADNLMKLTSGDIDNKLPHLFYFAGKKSNEGTKDEYLAAHIHNFMALNLKDASLDSTIVSYNRTLLTQDVRPNGDGSQTIIDLESNQMLKESDAWELELDFDLSKGAFFNGWGSGLLASGGNATIDGGTYNNGFQVYLQNSGNLVVRGGDSSANDGYKFTHTVGKYSTLKVVLTYANKRLQVAVTNSEGVTATIKDTKQGSDNSRDYIPCTYMSDITQLASAMAGASSFKLKAEVVLAMKWDTHENNTAAGADGDIWYILPSSNTEHQGLAIVTDGADDKNMGWSNVNGEDIEIFTAPGVDDFSTWQFEKVENFDIHIQELLNLYDIKDCVIYDVELVELYGEIQRIVNSGEWSEAIFNELFNTIRGYDGPMPDELKAPKLGSFYTIRPAVEENTENALLVHVDANGTYNTKEVYNGDVIRDDNSYDSRAAWVFDGVIENDGFFALNGLTVKNLHTQCYLTVPGTDNTMVSEDAASVTLAQLGACTTMFKVGNEYMVSAVRYAMDAGFWGSAITEYPTEVGEKFATVNGASTVHCKTFDVLVSEQGDVTVTFTHKGGNHKLNILGVTLTDVDGQVVVGDYRHTTAGGDPSVQTYTLTDVRPATYTLNCYVCELNGGDNDKLQRAQGDITFSGISQFTGTVKVINSGTATTKWIIEEIKNPETNIYYNVPSLSSATLPDTKAYASLYLGFDAKIPDGVTAWIVEKVLPNTQLVMVEVEGGIVPANTGLILSSENPMTNQKFYYSAIGSSFDADWNILTGTAYTKIVDCREQNVYMLGKKNDRIALYWTYENRDANGNKQTIGGTTNHNDSGYVMCNANKSYLEESTTNENAVSVYGFSFGAGTTDIDEVSGENEELETVYDLQGRKLEKVVAPGIYIVNGKKVLVK